MSENTFDLLAAIVAQARCFPSWSFSIMNEDGALRLVIQIDGQDNYHPERPFTVNHYHPLPQGVTYNEKSWRRWIYDRCRATMTHEIGEALNFDGVRPFVPMHGVGEDPYTAHEIRSELDALTTQDGSIRPGPV